MAFSACRGPLLVNHWSIVVLSHAYLRRRSCKTCDPKPVNCAACTQPANRSCDFSQAPLFCPRLFIVLIGCLGVRLLPLNTVLVEMTPILGAIPAHRFQTMILSTCNLPDKLLLFHPRCKAFDCHHRLFEDNEVVVIVDAAYNVMSASYSLLSPRP